MLLPGVLDNKTASVIVQNKSGCYRLPRLPGDHVAVHRQCLIRLNCYELIVVFTI
jgi:hypothetical protein